jgi:hypothetical protein
MAVTVTPAFLGKIHVLFVNAGIYKFVPLAATTQSVNDVPCEFLECFLGTSRSNPAGVLMKRLGQTE